MSGVLGVLAVLYLAWMMLTVARLALLKRVSAQVFSSGEFRAALKRIQRTQLVHGGMATAFLHTRICALEYAGLTRTALKAQHARDKHAEWRSPDWCNGIVCGFINAGRYAEALDAGGKLLELSEKFARTRQERLIELLHVNLAEALYNLGRWDDALEELNGLDEKVDRLTRAGLLNQRCWIFAHTGRAQEALVLHEQIDRSALPPVFFAEHHFTKAVVLIELGQLDPAEVELATARSVARRASSHRNATFLSGRLEVARGHLGEAERLYRAGARHRYQGQGGEGLLAWGDTLLKLDRHDEARVAWKLCLRRDSQSASASQARLRLDSKTAS